MVIYLQICENFYRHHYINNENIVLSKYYLGYIVFGIYQTMRDNHIKATHTSQIKNPIDISIETTFMEQD